MKKFRFCYSAVVWTLLALVLALSLVGLGWNIYNLVFGVFLEPIKIAGYAVMIVIASLLAAFVVSLMAFGRYEIKGEYLVTRFGFFASKTPIADIVEITHFKKSDKLVAYFKDEKYTVIVISPENYDAFILAAREVNPAIYYDSRIDGEDTPE